MRIKGVLLIQHSTERYSCVLWIDKKDICIEYNNIQKKLKLQEANIDVKNANWAIPSINLNGQVQSIHHIIKIKNSDIDFDILTSLGYIKFNYLLLRIRKHPAMEPANTALNFATLIQILILITLILTLLNQCK